MIETRHLKNVVIFVQTILSFVLSRKIITKNSDLDKYKYISYNKGFDSRSEFLFTDKSYGKNVIIFEADMSSSVHIDNEENYILILGEEPTQGINDTALTAEAKLIN